MPENKLYTKVVEFIIVLNSGVLLIPSKFKAYPIILLLLFSILYYSKSKSKIAFPFKKCLLISGLILLYFFSYFYSLQTDYAWQKLSTMSSLLAYPVIFGLLEASKFNFSHKHFKAVFIAFITSTVLFCFISFLFFWNQKYTFTETIIHYSNLINIGLGNSSIHPIYLSIYVGISLLLLISIFNKKSSLTFKIICFFSGIFLVIFLMILMRKGPIIYLFIATFLLIRKYFKIKTSAIAIVVGFLLLYFGLNILPKYKNENRFDDLTINSLNDKPNSSTAIRYQIYNCVVEKISENLLLGYGVGNVQQNLDVCYESRNFKISNQNYNSHNQFLSITLTIGLLGLILYLFTIFKIYNIYISNSSEIAVSILTFFMLNFLTENVLERENGMLIYSFLTCLFIYHKDASYKTL